MIVKIRKLGYLFFEISWGKKVIFETEFVIWGKNLPFSEVFYVMDIGYPHGVVKNHFQSHF